MKNERLKELKNKIEGQNYVLNEDVNELLNIHSEFELDYCDDIITIDTLEEMAKYELEDGGIERLYYFLPSDKNGNPYADNEYFIINGYGNVEVIEPSDILCIISDNLRDLEED